MPWPPQGWTAERQGGSLLRQWRSVPASPPATAYVVSEPPGLTHAHTCLRSLTLLFFFFVLLLDKKQSKDHTK